MTVPRGTWTVAGIELCSDLDLHLEKGAVLLGSRDESAYPARDTIGAGDSHLGTLMVCRASGHSWEDACALANRVSGTVCGVEGSTLSEEAFAASGLRL